MLKLSIAFSRKAGEPNYSSRGASVGLEVEIDRSLLADPNTLLARIRSLFALAQYAVQDQLARSSGVSPAPGTAAGPGAGPGKAGGHTATAASAAQVAAIQRLCQKLGENTERVVRERFGVNRPEDLQRAEASGLIDELKGRCATRHNGGNT